MSKKRKMTSGDPRKAGGGIAGPGGPLDRDAVVVDMTNAVLLEATSVCEVETYRGGAPADKAIAMTLSGRINQTDEMTDILYLFDVDGAAAIVTELIGLAARMGPEFSRLFQTRLDAVMKVSRGERGEG